jgi:glycosyltransferase involved in cell wall biosynthesis
MSKLSVVIITKNEQNNIQRCMDSVAWADEIIVYDSGSTDATVEIAKKLGGKVTVGEWMGFGPTKKHATLLANNDWILSLDADEEVSHELKKEIQGKMSGLRPEVGYRLPRLSNYLGRWIYYGGWYPDYQLRLFNREHSQWSDDYIHEKVKSKYTEKLSNNLNHYVFKNISHQVETNNRYSTLQAIEMKNKGKTFSWFHFFTKPTVKFLECYLLKLGFLDGWVGYLIARNAAYSVFLKWAKLRELGL